ncbi:hypothetical protein EKO23_04550 [Nocardioides guangzhouensis]|uniref:Uncharacterized protein n=1 Tax=Nocardioides guangzhouensis TaxID=2497878 RepID=A0A4Q4ZIN1_9ACTN|nr:hypothetical protein [Nocardioides guangzhouensis]RYP88112.1 hypothetical protein EKO23_04550 [Nocardioides guangzhouensis]
MDSDALLDLPYDLRRLIVVSDRLTERSEKTAQPASVAAQPASAIDGAGALSQLIAKQPRVALLVLAGAVGWELARAVRKLQAQGTTVRPIALTTAQSLRFPPGHPRTNVVYAAHPVDTGAYIPAADFHRFLFQHKVAEAQRLIRVLGATSVLVRSVRGWNRQAAAHLGLSFPEPSSGDATNTSSSADRRSDADDEIITTMTLTPLGDPYVPDDLVWFSHEPLWQEIASARIDSGLREFSIDVRSSDDFGINSKLKASVDKVGLEAGGKFVEHVETTWRLEGTFAAP